MLFSCMNRGLGIDTLHALLRRAACVSHNAVATLKPGRLPEILLYGDVGRTALRLWAPQLSHLPRNGGASTCKWCNQGKSVTGLHLLTCPAQPPRVQRLVARSLEVVRRDMRGAAGPTDPRRHLDTRRLYEFDWPGQEPGSTKKCMFRISKCIDEYSKAAKRSAVGALQTYDLVHPVCTFYDRLSTS